MQQLLCQIMMNDTLRKAFRKEYVYEVSPFNIVDHEGNLTVYELVDTIDKAGSFKVAYRIYPKNDLLPHRQDFCYVKWF